MTYFIGLAVINELYGESPVLPRILYCLFCDILHLGATGNHCGVVHFFSPPQYFTQSLSGLAVKNGSFFLRQPNIQG